MMRILVIITMLYATYSCITVGDKVDINDKFQLDRPERIYDR